MPVERLDRIEEILSVVADNQAAAEERASDFRREAEERFERIEDHILRISENMLAMQENIVIIHEAVKQTDRNLQALIARMDDYFAKLQSKNGDH